MVRNYEQMPIQMYGEILKVIKQEGLSDFDREIAMLSVITGKKVAELEEMPLADLRAITIQLGFLTEQPKPAQVKDEYAVGDYVLCPMKRIERITAGQFIDFQEWAKLYRGQGDVEYLPQILSCYLLPKGKVYNEGYDIFEVQDAIRGELSIADAITLLAFFLTSVNESQANILRYLEWRLRLMRARTPQQKKMKKIQIAKIREYRDSLKNGGGSSI